MSSDRIEKHFLRRPVNVMLHMRKENIKLSIQTSLSLHKRKISSRFGSVMGKCSLYALGVAHILHKHKSIILASQ